jgi:hypothetical protein
MPSCASASRRPGVCWTATMPEQPTRETTIWRRVLRWWNAPPRPVLAGPVFCRLCGKRNGSEAAMWCSASYGGCSDGR